MVFLIAAVLSCGRGYAGVSTLGGGHMDLFGTPCCAPR